MGAAEVAERRRRCKVAAKSLRIFSENFIAAVVSGWTFHEKSQLIGQ
jgi:hypothetical protein